MRPREGLATCEVLEKFLDNVHQVQLLASVAPVQVRIRELVLVSGLFSRCGFSFGRFWGVIFLVLGFRRWVSTRQLFKSNAREPDIQCTQDAAAALRAASRDAGPQAE